MNLKKKLKASLAVLLILGLLSSCGAQSTEQAPADDAGTQPDTASTDSADSDEAATDADREVTFVFTKGGFENVPDDDVIKQKIEEATGVTLNHIAPPGANYDEKLTLILSGQDGELPDLARLNKSQWTKMFDYADQGALMDLSEMVQDYPNILAQVPQEALDMCSTEDGLWGIPIVSSPNRMNTIIRQDWLDNLGLEAPETLDDYYNVMKAFTNDDPDGNGQDDTYGMTGAGLEGLEPYLGAYGVTGVYQGYFYEEGGELKAQAVNPAAKDALAMLNQWYSEGLIDPEFSIIKNDSELNDKAMKNQFGLTYRWWTWEPKIEAEMRLVDPDVTFSRIAPPVGEDGMSGNKGVGMINGVIIMLKDAQNPTAAMELIDWYHTEEGMMTVYSGVEDIHWEQKEDGTYHTLDQFDADSSWIQWYSAFESEWPLLQVETPLVQSRRDAFNWEVITNAADGLITDAELQYATDLNALITDAYVKIITGQEPIDYFDTFVEEWYSKGGQEWTDEVNALYSA